MVNHSIKDVAELTGKSVGAIRQLLRRGKITGEKIGSTYRGEWVIPSDQIEKIMRKGKGEHVQDQGNAGENL